MKEAELFCPASAKEWRTWLKENHVIKQSVWLVCYKKSSGMPAISHSEAVDEALCFGWIDGIRKSIDEHSFKQFYCKRKPKSTWSKVNKAKVQQLIDTKRMTRAGLASVELAIENGSWTSLDEVEELIVPKDLEKAFKANKGSKEYFMSLSKSVRKMMLHWITFAKRPETREKRINEIAGQAAQGLKPKQF